MGKLEFLITSVRALKGEILRRTYSLTGRRQLERYMKTPSAPVIVSMTSYGERVTKTTPAAVLSLLRQSVRPEKIVLWLDRTRWSDANLPDELKRLRKYGLDVRYRKDVRSYTKLVHALEEFPDMPVITVDDDLYYSRSFVKELYEEHVAYPSDIITLNFRYPEFYTDGKTAPYRKWKEWHLHADDSRLYPMLIFPEGFGGVLYPPGALHPDASDPDLFLRLSPTADDIWFYVMGLLRHTDKRYIRNTRTSYGYLDLLRQIRTHDRLHDLNVVKSNNDTQLQQSLAHYGIGSLSAMVRDLRQK